MQCPSRPRSHRAVRSLAILSLLAPALTGCAAAPELRAANPLNDRGPQAGVAQEDDVRRAPAQRDEDAPGYVRRARPEEPADHGAIEIGLGTGVRRQSDEAWEPAEDLFNFLALDLSVQPPRWPVEFTARFTGATIGEEPDFGAGFPERIDRLDVLEIDLGLRVPLDLGDGARAHVGGGLAWLEVTASEEDTGYFYYDLDEIDQDGDLGWWAGAGLGFPIGSGGHTLGFDARWTEADVELRDTPIEADGWTLLFAWTWRRPLE